MVKADVPVTMTSCCHKESKGLNCQHKQNQQKDDCGQGCSMMLYCSTCGFLKEEPVTIKPVFFTSIQKPALIYKMGNLPGYSTSDWKPPKV
jgi:hypothetical protein